jgi:hypothetical protein
VGADGRVRAWRLHLPGVRSDVIAHLVSARRPAVLAVLRMPTPVQCDRRHRLRGSQAAVDALVPGLAVAHTRPRNNASALEFTRQLGVSYRTMRIIKRKLLQAMALAESERRLSGRVEVDDSYRCGGKSHGKAGRGLENTLPFIVAAQTTMGP